MKIQKSLKKSLKSSQGVLAYGQSPREENEKYTSNRYMKIDVVKYGKHVLIK